MTNTPEQIEKTLADLRARREITWAQMEPLQIQSKLLTDAIDDTTTEKWSLPENTEKDFFTDLAALQDLTRDAQRNETAEEILTAWGSSLSHNLSVDNVQYVPDIDVPKLTYRAIDEVSSPVVLAVRKYAQAVAAGRTEVEFEVLTSLSAPNSYYLGEPTQSLIVSGNTWNEARIVTSRVYHDVFPGKTMSLRQALQTIAIEFPSHMVAIG